MSDDDGIDLELTVHCLSDEDAKVDVKPNVKPRLRKQTSTKSRFYRCQECARCFAYPSALIAHSVLVHGTDSNNGDRAAKNADRSVTHKRRYTVRASSCAGESTEAVQQPYSCHFCGRLFTQSGNMKKHLRTHTGERPYKCSECGCRFPQSGHLEGHMRMHTGEKPFVCATCGRRFTQSSNLRKHQMTHTGETPYKCKVCGKEFPQSTHLKQHVRMHTGERPYICEWCGRQFTQSSNLKKHKQSHVQDDLVIICPDETETAQCAELKPKLEPDDGKRQRQSSDGKTKHQLLCVERCVSLSSLIRLTGFNNNVAIQSEEFSPQLAYGNS